MAEIEEVKELFGSESLTYEQFAEKIAGAGDKINLVNLAGGGYISTEKHQRELNAARKEAAKTVPEDYEQLKADAEYKSKYDALLAKTTRKERLAAVTDKSKAGATVRPEFAEFVLAQVESTEEAKTDFEKALKDYVKQHPQYTAKAAGVVRIGSGAHVDGGESGKGGGSKFLNDFLINSRNR